MTCLKIKAAFRLQATDGTTSQTAKPTEHLSLIRQAVKLLIKHVPKDIVNEELGTVSYLMKRSDEAELNQDSLRVLSSRLARFNIFLKFESIQNKPYLVFFNKEGQINKVQK